MSVRPKLPNSTALPKTAEDREKLILKARSLFKEPWREDWYARPFTLPEAQRVLANAGIRYERVTGTALCDRSDPLGENQIIEAVVNGREMHFYLRYVGKWKVVKAFKASVM